MKTSNTVTKVNSYSSYDVLTNVTEQTIAPPFGSVEHRAHSILTDSSTHVHSIGARRAPTAVAVRYILTFYWNSVFHILRFDEILNDV
jgi:hypothetical protein